MTKRKLSEVIEGARLAAMVVAVAALALGCLAVTVVKGADRA